MQVIKNREQIAILLATYNGDEYLNEQLDSLLSQSYQDWHLYIHDDGSTDKTVDIIKEYRGRFPDKITVVNGEPTGGAKKNFFYLLKHVESSLYMFCDQDDVWLPNKIETEINAWNNEGTFDKPALVFTDLRIVDKNLDTIAESFWEYYNLKISDIKMESLILQNVITGCTLLINNNMRDMMIIYHDIDNVPMHDKWAAMIALQFGKIIRVNEQTIMYRQHEKNSVGAKKSSGISYLSSKLKDIKKLKATYALTRMQAQEFCNVFNLDRDDVLYEYGELDKKGKIRRLVFYYRNHFYTNRISQITGMILAG